MKAKSILFVLLVTFVFSCKKTEMTTASLNKEIVNDMKGNVIIANNWVTTGPCIDNFIANMMTFINKYGIGGSEVNNPFYLSERATAHNEVYSTYDGCSGGSGSGNGGSPQGDRNKPFLVILPPGSLSEWLSMVGVNNLCDQTQVNAAKARIAPLNAIIKRTVDDVGTQYYSSLYSSNERMDMIVEHMYASEYQLLSNNPADGNYFALLYLKFSSSLSKIPNVVANKLFDKPLQPDVPLDINGNPAYIDVEPWNGFLVDLDPAVNTLNDYCNASPPEPTTSHLPEPLPSANDYIYYQSSYNVLGQNIPQLATHIFLNAIDGKYYADQNPYLFLVPDGYYDSPTEIVGTTHKYYHIVNGIVTEILTIIVDPNGPIGPQ